MEIRIYQVDAFADQVFSGNPAAVCPLDSWIPDTMMQQIAMENNLSETAFLVRKDDHFQIRWFTPEIEIDLCGHATLASAHVIFNHLEYPKNRIIFRYTGGALIVQKENSLLVMDFPAISVSPIPISKQLVSSLGKKPIEVLKARDILAIFETEEQVIHLSPDFNKMMDIDCVGIIATAPGNTVDFVSRFFAPRAGINEDPVTGSAHCMLIPFWAARTGKNQLDALQLSKRGGRLYCSLNNDRVLISGRAITYLIGHIYI